MQCRLLARLRRVTTMRPEDYRIEISHLTDEDGGGFIARVPELPGCMSDGETQQEALANALDAIIAWVATAEAMGRTIPQPQLAHA